MVAPHCGRPKRAGDKPDRCSSGPAVARRPAPRSGQSLRSKACACALGRLHMGATISVGRASGERVGFRWKSLVCQDGELADNPTIDADLAGRSLLALSLSSSRVDCDHLAAAVLHQQHSFQFVCYNFDEFHVCAG